MLAGMAGGILNKKVDQMTPEERAIVSRPFTFCAITFEVSGLPRYNGFREASCYEPPGTEAFRA